MHVIFVLILVFGQRNAWGGPAPVRVGGFENLAECREQGARAMAAYADKGWAYCVPVNHLTP